MLADSAFGLLNHGLSPHRHLEQITWLFTSISCFFAKIINTAKFLESHCIPKSVTIWIIYNETNANWLTKILKEKQETDPNGYAGEEINHISYSVSVFLNLKSALLSFIFHCFRFLFFPEESSFWKPKYRANMFCPLLLLSYFCFNLFSLPLGSVYCFHLALKDFYWSRSTQDPALFTDL